MKIGFIGLGNMAEAMIHGMLKKELVKAADIYGSARTEATKRRVRETYGITVTAGNLHTAELADIVVLAVKPQFFDEVIEEIRTVDYSRKVVVSLAPGKSIEWLTQRFAASIPIVRCMPNTPALVGEGCTGMCQSDSVTQEKMEAVSLMAGSFGRVYEVPERLMDVVVGVSGSSPAYAFMFIEAMADAAVAEGMPRSMAYEMAAQAMLGSARLVLETGKHPGVLKDMVCSPGGTTIQAVKVLEEKNFRGTVIDAVSACVEKSKNM